MAVQPGKDGWLTTVKPSKTADSNASNLVAGKQESFKKLPLAAAAQAPVSPGSRLNLSLTHPAGRFRQTKMLNFAKPVRDVSQPAPQPFKTKKMIKIFPF